MSFLIRVLLPNAPGQLGKLAQAFGSAGGNIESVDIVQAFPDDTVMDDIVVSLPKEVMADVLITAANSLPGVVVDSIRPFAGRVDRRGQIAMLGKVARHSRNQSRAMDELMAVLPSSMTASWVTVLHAGPPVGRVAASTAAPLDDGTAPERIDVDHARVLHPDAEDWVPESWSVLDSALAATPLAGTDMVMVIARVGGPDFLAGEVEHLGHLGAIIGGLLRPKR